MKTIIELYEASLLDEIDDTLSVSSDDLRREAVKKFIKDNYDVAAPGAKISATPNKDDKFEVSARGLARIKYDKKNFLEYRVHTDISVAFVSTNSITQGEQVAPLWEKMFDEYGVHIDFAYRTFKWNSEAKEKAAVHCVIIGFSTKTNANPKIINKPGNSSAIKLLVFSISYLLQLKFSYDYTTKVRK